MATNAFFKSMKKEEFFYISIDGSPDRMIFFTFLGCWVDFAFHQNYFFLLFMCLLGVNHLIKMKIRVPRLGYAGYDSYNKKITLKSGIMMLSLLFLYLFLDTTNNFLLKNYPNWQTLTSTLFGNNTIEWFFYLSILTFILAFQLRSFIIYSAIIILGAIIQLFLYPYVIITPIVFITLVIASAIISNIKLVRFIKHYPVMNTIDEHSSNEKEHCQ